MKSCFRRPGSSPANSVWFVGDTPPDPSFISASVKSLTADCILEDISTFTQHLHMLLSKFYKAICSSSQKDMEAAIKSLAKSITHCQKVLDKWCSTDVASEITQKLDNFQRILKYLSNLKSQLEDIVFTLSDINMVISGIKMKILLNSDMVVFYRKRQEHYQTLSTQHKGKGNVDAYTNGSTHGAARITCLSGLYEFVAERCSTLLELNDTPSPLPASLPGNRKSQQRTTRTGLATKTSDFI